MAVVKARAVPIVALDFASQKEALAMVERLGDQCTMYKVGNELFTSAGPSIVEELRRRDRSIFLDLKFHDIPNTVAGGVRAARTMGASLITVHAAGGSAMLRAAVEAAGDQDRVGILGVTVLTSLTAPEVAEAWGRPSLDPMEEVVRLAGLVEAAGAHGIVCSGLEAPIVHKRFGARLNMLVPGVRPAGASSHDQARVVTPGEAARAGARYIVIGRAVTKAADPAEAMSLINAEIATAQS
jgi:orotidine-5'-phosphate decarboxylase